MEILLQEKRAYPWYTENGISVRGYFQLKTAPAVIYRGDSAVAYLSAAESFEALMSLLEAVDGVFSLIVAQKNEVWAAVDRARSMPLYYDVNGTTISDDSKSLRTRLNIKKEHTDPLRMAELMASGAVSACYTVYKEIRQIPMASAIQWKNGEMNTKTYYNHMSPIVQYSRETALGVLRHTAESAMDNIIKVIAGRPVVLSLSGGYDSRFIACMLKDRGIEQVYCYTYGVENSFEVAQSKKVAEALGYTWVCVTYTEDDIVNQLNEDGQAYIDTCYQHDFITYLQNYIAVKRLHEGGWFPANAVFLTGLCHDMPTGAYVEDPEKVPYTITADGVASFTMDYRFVRYRLRKNARETYLADLRQQIDAIDREISSYQDFVQVADVLNTGFDHSRRFLAMNHSHEFYGYEWLLPCWNQQLLDFWYSLPYMFRIHQNLYEEWLMKDLCEKYGIGTKKTLNQYTRSPVVNSAIRQVGGVVAWFCFKTHTTLRLRTDINGGAELRQRLYDGIHQKRAIKYSRASQPLLLALYMMEQRYGTHFWKDIREILKK